MIALKQWAYKLTAKNALIQRDNQVTVQAINFGRTTSSYMQAVLREILYITALNDTAIRVVHLPAQKNKLADAISRLHEGQGYVELFNKLTCGLKKTKTNISEKQFLFSHPW